MWFALTDVLLCVDTITDVCQDRSKKRNYVFHPFDICFRWNEGEWKRLCSTRATGGQKRISHTLPRQPEQQSVSIPLLCCGKKWKRSNLAAELAVKLSAELVAMQHLFCSLALARTRQPTLFLNVVLLELISDRTHTGDSFKGDQQWKFQKIETKNVAHSSQSRQKRPS